MCLQENEVALFQIDGSRRYVYINIRNNQRRQEILTSTNGRGEFHHTNGEISKAWIDAADLGMRRVRVANIPQTCPTKQCGCPWADIGKSRRCRKKIANVSDAIQCTEDTEVEAKRHS